MLRYQDELSEKGRGKKHNEPSRRLIDALGLGGAGTNTRKAARYFTTQASGLMSKRNEFLFTRKMRIVADKQHVVTKILP